MPLRLSSARGNKFNARKVELDGYKFDSAKEARRYQELCLLKHAGEVAELEVHPRYALTATSRAAYVPRGMTGTFATFATVSHYEPDFRVVYTWGEIVIEDVKSEPTKTPVYRLKRKLFEANYWPLTITEV